ncbi:hypothetical protein [Paenibacillus sp. FSL R10-2734]|uniref:hypothetical protein n=1 Tax=Paenibacillus sp. FSL R10-2734 TaxID=2954691 RepID=UPI0030D707C8
MSKLTEIKEGLTIAKEREITTVPIKTTDLEYLLSLLEEKDKALKEIANYRTSYKYEFVYLGDATMALSDCGDIARKAINTSSNNEGETI